jgi:hypothetical protein
MVILQTFDELVVQRPHPKRFKSLCEAQFSGYRGSQQSLFCLKSLQPLEMSSFCVLIVSIIAQSIPSNSLKSSLES